jgi:hypothetical protein
VSDWIDILGKLAPFIGAVALLSGTGVAWWTLFLVHRRTIDKAWVDGFSVLYRDFWKDPEMKEVRRWVVSETEYPKLETVLRRRFGNQPPEFNAPNTLDLAENEMLEKVDRFCSFMRQFDLFYRLPASRFHRTPWKALYSRTWLIRLQQREALRDYVRVFWPYFGI